MSDPIMIFGQPSKIRTPRTGGFKPLTNIQLSLPQVEQAVLDSLKELGFIDSWKIENGHYVVRKEA